MAEDQLAGVHGETEHSPDAADAADSVGSTLARARQKRGLTLAEVGHNLKFGIRQIEALEADQFEGLPRGTFLRGMVRSYARLLEIDPELLLARIAERISLPEADQLAARYNEPVPFSDSGKRLNIVYAALSLAVLVVAGVVAFEWGYSREKSSSNDVAASSPAIAVPAPVASVDLAAKVPPPPAPDDSPVQIPEPVADVPLRNDNVPAEGGRQDASRAAVPEPRAAAGRVVRFRFDRDSWVHVVDGSGHVLMSQVNPRGSESYVEGRPPLSLVIGNAQHVKVRYQGEPIDLAPHIKVEVARFTLPLTLP